MELELVSGSTNPGELPGCDIRFQIPRSIQNLSLWAKWSGITPFRNRFMIEELFSVPSARTELEKLVGCIDKELKAEKLKAVTAEGEVEEDTAKSEAMTTVRVGISCLNGTQVSPCFVEKLWEMYTYYSRSSARCTFVHRHHRDAFPSPKSSKQKPGDDGFYYVWQHSRLPTNYLEGPRDLLNKRMWVTLPMHLLAKVEEDFLRDPFNEKLEIRYSKGGGMYVINFQTGEMYSKHEAKSYRICCTTASNVTSIECQMLTGSSYKSVTKHYQGAGVLFYAVHPKIGEPVFLLGHMTYGSRSWCDFGGLKKFREYPRQAAARECYEETLGVLGSNHYLVKLLEDYKTNNCFKIVNQNTDYVSHFVRVPYGDYPAQFTRTILRDELFDLEVDEMRWFSLSALERAIDMLKTGSSTIISAFSIFEDGSLDSLSHCPLRHEFIGTLCIAKKLKFLQFIKSICKRLYLKSLCLCHSKDPETGTELCIGGGTDLGMELRLSHDLENLKLESKDVVEAGSEAMLSEEPGLVPQPDDGIEAAVIDTPPSPSSGEMAAKVRDEDCLLTEREDERRGEKCAAGELLYGMGVGKITEDY